MDRLTRKSILGGWTSDCLKQEVVDRLAAYEDTGLDPEEINDLKITWDMYGGEVGIVAILDELERLRKELSNEPLTLEALREMNWEPVWCEDIRRWGMVMRDNIGLVVMFDLLDWVAEQESLEKLTFYRRKSEEVAE